MSVDVRSMTQDEYMSKLVHPMLNEALEVVIFYYNNSLFNT